MQVWTVSNQKGGVGKTTTVVTLAGLLVKRGYRVLAVDTDPQASLGYYLGVDPDELPGSLFDLFRGHDRLDLAQVESVIVPTGTPQLDLLPASTALATLDRTLGTQDGMGLILKRVLAMVAHRYDAVLIDCPPVLGVLMINALAACDRIVVPVQTEFLALKGLDRMVRTLDMVGRSKGIRYPFTIVPTMFDKRTRASLQALTALTQKYPRELWHSVIPVDTRFRDASQAHLPPSHFDAGARGVQAYDQLLDALLDPQGGAHV
ncbi:ParA family protein [Ferrimonas sediminicola]|uniref:ParA family protein n=1 Tax=Ferrimonas sediminicola TaxID=2569538 RepID=A0A4U1BB34_9GAMM|nr:ParA family protein [Ferrimonas sediminicola]TKB47220.1 ParA family protein [Ferrimonas sediminicola]